MNHRPRFLILLALFTSAIFVVLVACQSLPPPPQLQVELSVRAASASFVTGDPVRLQIELKNIGTSPARVGTMADGNLRMIAVDRNGTTVIPRETAIRYVHLKSLLNSNLQTLGPGQSTTIEWITINDPPQNAQAFQVVRYDPEGALTASLSAVSAPGSYTVTLVYRFGDPWAQPLDLYTGETNQASAQFSIAP